MWSHAGSEVRVHASWIDRGHGSVPAALSSASMSLTDGPVPATHEATKALDIVGLGPHVAYRTDCGAGARDWYADRRRASSVLSCPLHLRAMVRQLETEVALSRIERREDKHIGTFALSSRHGAQRRQMDEHGR